MITLIRQKNVKIHVDSLLIMFKSLDDIEILGEKHLGEGAFSEVFRVRHRKDNKIYAMKIVCSQGGCVKDFARRYRESAA